MPSSPSRWRAAHAFLWKRPILFLGGSTAVLLLALALGEMTSDIVQQSARAYSDVAADAPPATAIGEMTTLGILRGYENGLFGPGDPVTREQIAILLKRLRDRDLRALRAQVEEIRITLALGACGDGVAQTGEECDDGNAASGDGCSAECLAEIVRGCPGGRRIGEEYAAEDGCNTCICTERGAICTKMYCAAPEEHVPEEPVEPPAVPSNVAPLCGNGICEAKENLLPPDRRFHCPEDCTGAPVERQCEKLTQEFHAFAEASRACQSDADCDKVEQSCPFLTCGEAVNKSNSPTLSLKRDEVIETCRREGSVKECVTCAYSAALCRDGQCVLVQGR